MKVFVKRRTNICKGFSRMPLGVHSPKLLSAPQHRSSWIFCWCGFTFQNCCCLSVMVSWWNTFHGNCKFLIFIIFKLLTDMSNASLPVNQRISSEKEQTVGIHCKNFNNWAFQPWWLLSPRDNDVSSILVPWSLSQKHLMLFKWHPLSQVDETYWLY